MEENNKLSWKNIVPELLLLLVAAAGIFGYGMWKDLKPDVILKNIVMVTMGFSCIGFGLRQEYLNHMLSYNNSWHILRFWGAAAIGLLISFACVFLPTGGWPFLTVFVMLTSYSSLSMGVLTSGVLLMIPTLVGDAGAGVFFLYFVSGMFAAYLFRNLENEFTIGVPWLLSMLCLFVCETANIVLPANEQLSFELFVIPAINVIISSILLVGFLNIFSRSVVYQYRDRYLEINDTENPMLAAYRQENKNDYFQCIHTAYFCERIAAKLNMDVDALKCAGYYHKLYLKPGQQEEMDSFPPGAAEILREYQEKRTRAEHRETVVLICADAIVSTIIYMLHKSTDKGPDYDAVIDAVFKKFQDGGTFNCSDITMRELKTMQKIFKEEKLYYDFLR